MVQVVGKDESEVRRVTCRNCASVLQYVNAEVKDERHYDYGGGSDIYYYITCPCCNKNVTVSSRY